MPILDVPERQEESSRWILNQDILKLICTHSVGEYWRGQVFQPTRPASQVMRLFTQTFTGLTHTA